MNAQHVKRIVTRADFDSVVCAVLLFDALGAGPDSRSGIRQPVKWIEPSDVQKGLADIREGDVLANLPYASGCTLWFDHHFSNQKSEPVAGMFKIAPSAAGVVFEYYRERFERDYSELVQAADKIDAADLSLDEVLHPERYPYVLLSMTISGQNRADEPYWNHLVDILGTLSIDRVMDDPLVKDHCDRVIGENERYRQHLIRHTHCEGSAAITDFRPLMPPPTGNRFLVYSMFPDCCVHMKIRFDIHQPEMMIVSVGHSIFNKTCRVNIGRMLTAYEGGGHQAVGACRFHKNLAEKFLPEMIKILVSNEDVI